MISNDEESPFLQENNHYEQARYEILSSWGHGHPVFTVAVSKESPIDLKRKLLASLKSYEMGLKSVDRILRNHSDEWTFSKKTDPKLIRLMHRNLDKVLEILKQFSEDILEAHGKSDGTIGMLAADLALYRLLSTFDCLSLLIRRGYIIEAKVLMRTVVEQIAWAWQVKDHNDEEKILKIDPRYIKPLKKIFPQIGYLYGHFSEYVHLSAKQRLEYFSVTEEKKASITFRDRTRGYILSVYCIELADLLVSANEIIHVNYYQKAMSWKVESSNSWLLDSNRPLNKLMQENLSQIQQIERN